MTQKQAIQALTKQHGEGAVMLMGQRPLNVERCSSGILQLDEALGGGWPIGRIMEMFGPESSGKTTIALYMMLAALESGRDVAFMDLENALDPVFARDTVGLDLDKVLFSQPDSAEKALDIVVGMVEHGAADLIVVDSVAALTPRAEIEGEMGDSHMGLVARLMAQSLRKINNMQIQSGNKTTVLFINQLRMKIGVMFGNPETTPGGESLKYYSSVRIDVRSGTGAADSKKPGQIREGDEVIGKRIRTKVIKNKVAPPFKTAMFDLMFPDADSHGGIDPMEGLLFVAVNHNLIGNKGAWYYDDQGEKLAQGKRNMIQYLHENPEYAEQVKGRLFA